MTHQRSVIALLVGVALGTLGGWLACAAVHERARTSYAGTLHLGVNSFNVQWAESPNSKAGVYTIRMGERMICYLGYDRLGSLAAASLDVLDADRSWTANRAVDRAGAGAWRWSTESPHTLTRGARPVVTITDTDNDGLPDLRSTDRTDSGAGRTEEVRKELTWEPAAE